MEEILWFVGSFTSALQLLAVTFPVVLFHFFSLYTAGQIEKLKHMEEELERTGNDRDVVINI